MMGNHVNKKKCRQKRGKESPLSLITKAGQGFKKKCKLKKKKKKKTLKGTVLNLRCK